MFNHPYRHLFILALAALAFSITELCRVYYFFHIDVTWYHALITIGAITLLTWESSHLLEYIIRRKLRYSFKTIYFLALFFFLANVLATLATCLVVAIIGIGIYNMGWDLLHIPLKLNLIYAFLITLLFHLINAILVFFDQYKHQWKETEELRKLRSQAEIQLIKSQIQPHFLFNNLNILSGMVIKDNPDANKFIEAFAAVYRYILNHSNTELIELSKELDFVETYLYLLKKRFDSGVLINIDVPISSRNAYVIPASLQVLVENAFKHNIVSRSKPLTIEIVSNEHDSLVVKNNLQPRTPSDSSNGIGLNNIHKQYKLISGKMISIKKTSETFEVTIPLLKINSVA